MTTHKARAAPIQKGVRQKGRAREAEIVAAARKVLETSGYGEFTLRNVAERVDMRMSHLQYYYATKGDLVRAILAQVAAEYQRKSADVLASVPDTPTARFMAWVDFLLRDCWDSRTRHFFIQLWGLAESEEPAGGELLREFYATDITEIRSLLEELSPHLSDARLSQRSTIIAGVIEGMMLMVGSGPRNPKERRELMAETRKQIFRIATEA